jgi:hypothetical protein
LVKEKCKNGQGGTVSWSRLAGRNELGFCHHKLDTVCRNANSYSVLLLAHPFFRYPKDALFATWAF